MSRYQTIEGELEDEAEFEWEGEFEDEYELEGEFEDEFEWEDEFEGLVRELEDEYEDEYELEGEFEAEYEDFADPNLRASRLGLAQEAELMAHFATQAANAESEAEMEAFLGALIPAAARLIPKAAPLVRKFAPQLIRGVANVGKKLWNRPETRNLVKAVPSAVVKTVGDLAGQWGDGKNITARRAAGTFGKNMADALGAGRGAAVRATNQLNRRHQRRTKQQPARGGYRSPQRRRRAAPARRRVAGRRR